MLSMLVVTGFRRLLGTWHLAHITDVLNLINLNFQNQPQN